MPVWKVVELVGADQPRDLSAGLRVAPAALFQRIGSVDGIAEFAAAQFDVVDFEQPVGLRLSGQTAHRQSVVRVCQTGGVLWRPLMRWAAGRDEDDAVVA